MNQAKTKLDHFTNETKFLLIEWSSLMLTGGGGEALMEKAVEFNRERDHSWRKPRGQLY